MCIVLWRDGSQMSYQCVLVSRGNIIIRKSKSNITKDLGVMSLHCWVEEHLMATIGLCSRVQW